MKKSKKIIKAKSPDNAKKRKKAEETLHHSEERYQTILENIQEGYFEVDLAGNLTFFNDAACLIMGYPQEELMGMNNRQHADEENAKKVFQAFNKVYNTGEPIKELCWQITRKDGNKRYIEASVSLLQDSSGKPRGFRGIVRDITERKKVEELLKKSEEQYRLLADNMTAHIWLWDLNTRKIIYVSPSVEKMYGYTLNEITKLSLKKILTAESLQKMLDAFSTEMTKALAKPLPYVHKYSLELEACHKDGHLFWIEVDFSILRDENGKPLFMLGETRDITERKRAEETLRQSEGKYRTILTEMQEGYFEVDLAGNFTFFNDSLSRLLGYYQEELMGMNYHQYTDKEYSKKLFQAFNKVYSTGKLTEGFD